MEILVSRQQYGPLFTIGELFLDGQHECFTLEDRVRPIGEKVPGSTAIPEGRYRVAITPSQRFGRELPILLDVPGFVGIRIHAGNTATDTEGCILVGKDRHADWIGRSRDALEALLPKLTDALKQGEIWCQVEGLVADPTTFASGETSGAT